MLHYKSQSIQIEISHGHILKINANLVYQNAGVFLFLPACTYISFFKMYVSQDFQDIDQPLFCQASHLLINPTKASSIIRYFVLTSWLNLDLI